mgnify:FL=1
MENQSNQCPVKKTKYDLMRERVQKIEKKLHDIIGYGTELHKLRRDGSRKKREQIEGLLSQRKRLLNRMFLATPEEVARMEQLNNLLLDQTKKLYARTEELYRKMTTMTYNPDFDDDVEVVGTLRFVMDGKNSLLPMSNDDYYGSKFANTWEVISSLCRYKIIFCNENIEFVHCSRHPSDYRPDMSSKELGTVDILNDGQTWLNLCKPIGEKFWHICICHAVYDLSMNQPYSIPDILRMNDFWTEVSVIHQHFASVNKF